MFENVKQHKGLTNPLKNGEKTRKVLGRHDEMLAKIGIANSPRNPMKGKK